MGVDLEGLRERVEGLPGLDHLLPALEGLPPAYLVGGAVRDLLRGSSAVDLDLAVEGDAGEFAAQLAERLGGEAVEHGRFGTAKVVGAAITVDVARTRRERYAEAGALPDVEPAPLGEDLARRDFSINAMALGLSGGERGNLHDPFDGVGDLASGTVRVLHERSFTDDATRILRALRYEARLGFRMDPTTEGLAREAAALGGLDSVAGSRVRDELLDLLAEPEAPSAVARLAELGVDRALNPQFQGDPELVASAALASIETGADPALAKLSALAGREPPGPVEAEAIGAWLDRSGFRADERDAVVAAMTHGATLRDALRAPLKASELHALLAPEPLEALALALALGAPGEPVLRFLSELRPVRLEITGDDLLAAGVAQGPAIGRALDAVLRLKLDGEVGGREAELAAAVEAAR